MKKIKIIDLLNMISKGEEVPKKIKYENLEYVYSKDNIDYKYEGDKQVDRYYLFYSMFSQETNILNDEVEIIEENPTLNDIRESYGLPRIKEHKIPEKLKIRYKENDILVNEKILQEDINDELANKINEILDYLEVKND